MANKTVLDFLAVTSTDPADVLYLIRGTGAGRDKKITWANLTANLLDKTVTSAQTVVGPVSIVPTSDAVALSLTAKNNFRALAAECSHNNTTGSPPVISIKQTTSGDMGPGFGAAIRYQIRDDAGVDNTIADLRASRDDADNSGKVEIQVANAGVMATRLTVDKTGVANASLKLQEAGVDISAKYAPITSGKPSGSFTSITSTQTIDPVNGMTYVFESVLGTTLTLSLNVAAGTTCFVTAGSLGASDGYCYVNPDGAYAPSVWIYGKAGASGALYAPAMFVKYGAGSNPASAGWAIIGGRNGVAS